jgi:flagellar hook-basal body complex protein FliE
MDLNTSLAALGYSAARRAAGSAPNGDEPGAGETARAAAAGFAATLRQGEETAKAAMVGDADPHTLVQALAASELAVQTAVTLRDRVVEAYQEILRMPV